MTVLNNSSKMKKLHICILVKTENGDLHQEQHELLMKDRDSGTQFRSDSDNRSHASGLSSHPSHSSQSQHSRSRRSSLDRYHYPRHELQTLGIMGRSALLSQVYFCSLSVLDCFSIYISDSSCSVFSLPISFIFLKIGLSFMHCIFTLFHCCLSFMPCIFTSFQFFLKIILL